MRDIINKLKQIEESQTEPSGPQVGDEFGLSFSDDLEISTTITDVLEDGIVVEMDDDAIAHMTENGVNLYDGEIVEEDKGPCWKNYKQIGMKKKGGKQVPNCVPESIEEMQPVHDMTDTEKMMADIGRLIGDMANAIPLKGASDDEVQYSMDLDTLGHKLTDGGIKSMKDLKNFTDSARSNADRLMKDFEEAVKKYQAGERFDRSKIKDPNPEMEKEDSELDRIKQLSGVQTEGHGPEVDSFFEKVAANPDEGWDLLYDAASGKHGDKIYKAVIDMYNDISIDIGAHPDDDFEKIYDRMLDNIEADYGPKESFGESQISELSPELLNRYQDAAFSDAAKGMAKKRMGTMSTKDAYDNEKKRYAGIDRAKFLLKMKEIKAKKQGKMSDDISSLANAVMDEGASDSVNMAKLKQAVGGEEALVTTLHASAVQNHLDDDEFIDAAKRMLNMSRDEIQAIIDKSIQGDEEESITSEAEYQGRKVSLGKPTRGDVKKFKVYVKNPKGNVVKVNFGDPNMKIKKSNPARRKSFRARHNCANPGPRHKARYWSCRKW
jgi:hypothetical protein